MDFKRMLGAKAAEKAATMDKRQQAAMEMKLKTVLDGRRFVREHVGKIIKQIVPQPWRKIANLLFPAWWGKSWMALLEAFLFVARMAWEVISFLPVRMVRRLALAVWKGGAYSNVEQGSNEWTVVIKVYRGFRLRYQCDMDVRSGRVFEEIWHGTKK